MNDQPTAIDPRAFEARLTTAFAAYADRAPVEVDAVTLTALVARGGMGRRRSRFAGGRRYLVPVLLGLLLVALAAGVVIVGSGLLDRRPESDTPQQPAVVAPSADPSADVTPAPVSEPYVEPTRQPDPSERPSADQPCPAMIQLLQIYGGTVEHVSDPVPSVGPVTGNGDILVRTIPEAVGGWGIGRFDPSQSPPAPVEIVDGVELPFQSAGVSSSIGPAGRLVASPDGRAVAFEAGDLGQAGCGDPIVVPAGNGLRRPFPGRAFETISDLAWAPDGSALYGIRRPTLDALGQPYTANAAQGTVVRWDATTAEATELPPGCEACSWLFVSPDGSRIAAEGNGVIKIYDAEGGWRDLTSGDRMLGWIDDRTIVTRLGRVDLDGGSLAWPDATRDALDAGEPLLSPDGTTIAVMAGSHDLKHRDVIFIDVRDGSSRVAWSALLGIDCDAAALSTRQRCLEGFFAKPGPDTVTDHARIAAWAPDGSAVLVLDVEPYSTEAALRVLPVDGSGARPKVTVRGPALSPTLNWSPSVAWLPATAP